MYWITDSRQVMVPEQSIFFAIKGERHDGHRFIGELYEKGVRHFVVDRMALSETLQTELEAYADARFEEVANSLQTLQKRAAEHRAQFSIPVIGITGSNGKTIVKEWLAQLLSSDFSIARSPKSYNSQVGVPLSVRPLDDSHTLGIFEAGISKPHEMQALEEIIRPTIGIFTNIGTAHDEGFRSRKQKVAEKLRLFTRVKTLVYRQDYPEIDEEINLLLKAVNPALQLIRWSTADVSADFLAEVTGNQLFLSQQTGRKWSFKLPFTDPASVENLIHCIVTLTLLGITNEVELQARLNLLRPVSMRLELKEGINGCVLIDDSYNNDVAGLQLALSFLHQQTSREQKVIILSDVLQSGQREDELYAHIGRLIREQTVDRFIGIGPELSRNAEFFPEGSQFFASTDEFLTREPLNRFRDSVVLVKGARTFSFERIVHRLQRKFHGTVLEINLDALTHNLNYYRQKAGSSTKIMVMVKAFAYGSGSAEVAQLLQYHRVDYLAVAYADEGVSLRQNGIDLPIMVMNPAPETFRTLLEFNLEPEIYSFRILDEWNRFLSQEQGARGQGPGAWSEGQGAGSGAKTAFDEQNSLPQAPRSLHLKIDTGMHRLGFRIEELETVASFLKDRPYLRVASVFSHLVGADEAQFNSFSREQFELFLQGTTLLENSLGYRPIRHILNSAGIVRFPEFKLDMVRLGIGLYGVEATQQEQRALRSVGTLKTVISQIKSLKAGETVGYSRKGILEHDARIATLAIGYADGYDRRLSNGVGQVLVNGILCPTVGSVCMDMTMIDVSQAVADEGDEVIVFGADLPITHIAKQIDTIPYELLTGVSERVKRVFYKE